MQSWWKVAQCRVRTLKQVIQVACCAFARHKLHMSEQKRQKESGYCFNSSGCLQIAVQQLNRHAEERNFQQYLDEQQVPPGQSITYPPDQDDTTKSCALTQPNKT